MIKITHNEPLTMIEFGSENVSDELILTKVAQAISRKIGGSVATQKFDEQGRLCTKSLIIYLDQ